MKALGAPQERMLVCIWDAWRAGRAVLLRELLAASGFTSVSTAHYWLVEFARHGLVTIDAKTPAMNKYTRGPLLGGVYQGRPMRLIEDGAV